VRFKRDFQASFGFHRKISFPCGKSLLKFIAKLWKNRLPRFQTLRMFRASLKNFQKVLKNAANFSKFFQSDGKWRAETGNLLRRV
jgi:hypothetical protein